MPSLRPIVWLVLLGAIAGALACSSAESDPAPAGIPAASTSGLTAANILEHERAWPDIVALTEPWTPPGAPLALKQGYRGALIRVDDAGRARIDFGRHGKHDIPLESTDLIARAIEVEAGTRHKVAPNFLAHFGTQFVHPSGLELVPFPTPELAKSERFLCIFANPRDAGFEDLARRLASLGDVPGLQALFFPLAMERDELQPVKDALQKSAWAVPFAYPRAAEMHAQSLLGELPDRPYALLVTSEGRLLHRSDLAEAGVFEALRAAASPPSSPRHN